jgi:manganese-dependent inorganic pyrophosphatase
MESTERPLLVIGHKNPDTDSIAAAIAYAHYKRTVAGVKAVACRAGNVNPQTAFVLDRFGVAHPELVTTLHPKLSDIMIRGEELVVLREDDPLGVAQEVITGRRFAFLPVVDGTGRYAGKISALRLAGLVRELDRIPGAAAGPVWLRRFVAAIGGRVVAGDVPETFPGKVWIQGLGPVPDAGAGSFVAVLPGCDGTRPEAERDAAAAALARGASGVVATRQEALGVAGEWCLALPLESFVEREHPTFRPHDLVREVRKEVGKSNEGGFIVVDDDGSVRGVVTRLNFLEKPRFRVALVDHNEPSQAVDGIEEADVEEIIDHHRLGFRGTEQPITFLNKVVGCTCTIVAELFRNAGQAPPPEVAGVMLAAILSDTVILRSPTTTALDREMAAWLAGLAGVEAQDFGERMFAAGCAVEGIDPGTIVRQDLKVYEENGWKLSVSQMEMVGFDGFRALQGALAAELDRAREEAGCHLGCLMVTDITGGTSLLLCAGEPKIIGAVTYPRVGENLFEMAGVLSRKKQMMPYLADLLRRL